MAASRKTPQRPADVDVLDAEAPAKAKRKKPAAKTAAPSLSDPLPTFAPSDPWLKNLFVAYQDGPFPADHVGPIRLRLRSVPFDVLIDAINAAQPALGVRGEILAYQDWIAGNAGVSDALFAAYFNLAAALMRAGDADGANAAYQQSLALKVQADRAAIPAEMSPAAAEGPKASSPELAAWLQTLLVAYADGPFPAAHIGEVYQILRVVPLDDVSAALNAARPDVSVQAEILIYQDWLAANGGTAPEAFAAWYNLSRVLAKAGDAAAAETAFNNFAALQSGAAPKPAPPASSETVAWLQTLLFAYNDGPFPPEYVGEILARLKHVTFQHLSDAMDLAPPAVTPPAKIQLYQDWIAANTGVSPHLFAAWFNIGVLLAHSGNPVAAETAYANALALKPDFDPAATNRGLTLEALGRPDAALEVWSRALQPVLARTTLLNHQGRLLENLGRYDEAEAALLESLKVDPEQPDAMSHWLHLRQKMCKWPVLSADFGGFTPEDLLRRSGPLGVLALTDDVAVQTVVGAAWIARKTEPAPRLSPLEGYRHDKIRIGYLSSDFCRHAMSYLIAELFERHDRSRFEVYGYCSSREDGSEIRQRVLGAFDHYRIIRDISDEQAAQRIRQDEIDILVDLNGLTAGTRMPVLRWKPAPVQATYLGFIGPVALPELDYMLCDAYVAPPGEAEKYWPKPLYVAPVYQANDSKRGIGAPLTRAECGLPDDAFVFCCFCNHYKITEEMFGAWMQILQASPGSVLWLTADCVWSCDNMRAAAVAAGVAPERLIFAERCDPNIYMSRLAVADLFLDTTPYNAGTVASDAIRMKLPLVTYSQRSFASRMAGSLLTAVGAGEGVAESLPDYIAKAQRLATDAQAYAAYKALFDGDAWDRALGDIAAFARSYEQALAALVAPQL